MVRAASPPRPTGKWSRFHGGMQAETGDRVWLVFLAAISPDITGVNNSTWKAVARASGSRAMAMTYIDHPTA